MTMPKLRTLFEVVDATWPAAKTAHLGPWQIRQGAGGGSRVSSAVALGSVTDADIPQACAAMQACGQTQLFQIRDTDADLDTLLEARGFTIKDPSVLYVAPLASMTTKRPPPVTSFEVWPPLQAQRDIWSQGGIGAERLAVMARAPHPKTTLLGRVDDAPLGTTFVALSQGIAMIHALEIAAAGRRKGLARQLTRAAAFWASAQGATHLALVTTTQNTAANGLYASLGMQVVGHYHYRINAPAARIGPANEKQDQPA